MAQQRLIDLTSPLGADALLFHQVRGTETLGRQFEYEIFALSERNDLNFDAVLGQHVTLNLELPQGGVRHIDGRVAQFGLVGMSGRYFRYRIVARSWTWLLTRTTDCRIFQELSVPDIIKQVFADHPEVHFEPKLSGTYNPREYCVQYRESDFDFVSRLMEEVGIYTFFKHEPGKHTLVLTDSVTPHPSLGKLPFLPQTAGARMGTEFIREWQVSREIQPGKAALRDYNFEKPTVDLLVQRIYEFEHAQGNHEIFDYPGEYPELQDGDALARTRLEEVQAQYEIIEGSGSTRVLACGGLFSLTGFIRQDQNREYLVIATTIKATDNAYESGAQEGIEYDCRFTLMPSKEPYRAPRVTRRPIVRGPQTAVVVGPPSEEIFVDKFGRVKCQFFWDRYGKSDDKSSCWIRVSQIWAGKNWGWMTIPRIGQEVIVSFLEGNPDNPIITGRVYNAEQMPPWELPGNKTQSGILTRSSAGGAPANANHLKFEDKKGDELIDIHAEKNMSTHVENDDSTFVGNDQSLVVKRDQSTIVQRDQTLVVTRDRTVQVNKNESQVIKVDQKLNVIGNQDIKVDSNHNMTVGGTYERTVTGKVTTISDAGRVDTVKGNDDHKVTGTLTTAADGVVTISSGAAIILAAPHIEEQVSGANSKIIGVPSGPLKMMAAKIQSISGGDIDLLATGNINMVCMESNTTVLGKNASGYIGQASDTMIGLSRSSQLSLSMETVVGAALTNKLAVEMENVLGAKITTAAGPEVEMRSMKTIIPGGGGGGPGVLSAGQTTAATLGVVAGVLVGAKSFSMGFGELSDQYAAAKQQLQDAARDAEAAGFPSLAARLNNMAANEKFKDAASAGEHGKKVGTVANVGLVVVGAAAGALATGTPQGVVGGAALVGAGLLAIEPSSSPETTYEQRKAADDAASIDKPEPKPD